MIKKGIAMILLMVLALNASFAASPVSGAFLDDQLYFKLGGKAVVPVGDDGTPVLPISYNGTTYLPLRAIGYLLGLGLEYDGASKTISMTSGSDKAAPTPKVVPKTNQRTPISGVFENDALRFKLDGKAVIPLGSDGKTVLPLSYNGTTYLPLRAIGTMLGLNIDYDGASKTIAMSKAGPSKVWRLKNTVFKDATMTSESYLMGTTSVMVDVYAFEGSGTSLIITHDRYDKASGKPLAGVTYEVNWTAPPEYLVPGEKYSVDYSVKTIDALTWTSGQQTIYLNQGWGIYFASASGVKFIGPDSSDTYTLEQAVNSGVKGNTRTIQFNHGNSFATTYEYEWID